MILCIDCSSGFSRDFIGLRDLSLLGCRRDYAEECVDPRRRIKIFQNLKFDRIYSWRFIYFS